MIIDDLSKYVDEINFDSLPARVVELAKYCLIDWLGVTIAGSKEPMSSILLKVARRNEFQGISTIIGIGLKTDPLNAALINGTMAHALDYDDYMPDRILHPSAPLWACLIAAFQMKPVSGKELLTAFIIGLEVAARIAKQVGKLLIVKGFHPTGLIGTIGSAVGAGKLLGLKEDERKHALAIACTQAAGLSVSFGTMSKPLHSGKAAMNGLFSALLAGEGFTGSVNILDDKESFSAVLVNQALSGIDFGSDYHIYNIAFKSYPACGPVHAAIDASLDIKKYREITLQHINSIICEVSSVTAQVADNVKLISGLDGKFSLSYCIAIALTDGYVNIEHFTDIQVKRPEIKELMNKITIKVNEEYSSISETAIIVKIENGNEYIKRVKWAKGTPNNPMDYHDLENKFNRLVKTIILDSDAKIIVDRIYRLEQLSKEEVNELINLCRSRLSPI